MSGEIDGRLRVSVVVLAYGPEPWLADCVRAVLASTGLDLDVVVVDNGCTGAGIAAVGGLPAVRVLQPGANTGYAGGCRIGADAATGEILAFVNSDAIVAPDALWRLATVAAEAGVGAATASVRLAQRPDTVNSAGNPLHVTGLSWAGGHGEPAARHPRRRAAPLASGACFAIRRNLWRRLDGFAEEYFAYHEDAELSLRLWQRGLRVEYVPEAVVRHHYEFARNDRKSYLLERNRLITVLTAYQARTLLLLAPLLLLTEAAVLATALGGGWGRQKIRGWGWLWRHRRWLRARRRRLQRERRVPDGQIAVLLTARVNPGNAPLPRSTAIFNAVSVAYWALVRPLLDRGASRTGCPPDAGAEAAARAERPGSPVGGW